MPFFYTFLMAAPVLGIMYLLIDYAIYMTVCWENTLLFKLIR
jgi:hypothetical protein